MSSAPSVSSSITVRMEVQARPTAVSELTTTIEQLGGIVTALDVRTSVHERIGVDVNHDGSVDRWDRDEARVREEEAREEETREKETREKETERGGGDQRATSGSD